MDIGVEHIIRDTLLSSIGMTEVVLRLLGMEEEAVQRVTQTFLERDQKLLVEQHAVHDHEEKLRQSSEETMHELRSLLAEDLRSDAKRGRDTG
jgi:glutathione-regulated potassium-efflux system protein KefB